MPKPEIDLLAIDRGTITAPAGCGKTQLIAEALGRHTASKPILVLTHTNAGVAALRARFEKAGVPSRAYRISTIDGWMIRLIATFPGRSAHDPEILKLARPGMDYPAIRNAACALLKAEHLSDVLAATYDRLIVDEYQDCGLVQHACVFHIAKSLRTCVLGDPLQMIFDFQGTMADWDGHVCTHFPLVGELTTPWRWKNAGEEDFGRWILDVRRRLLANEPIDLGAAPPNVTWIHLDGTEDHQRRMRACRVRAPNPGGSVLIIADSRRPAEHHQFASQTPDAVTVENVDLRDLTGFAGSFNLLATSALPKVIEFAESVMTNVGGLELQRRLASLRRGTARKDASDVEQAALDFEDAPTYAGVRILLAEIGQQAGVRNHRPGILRGCINALRLAESPGGPGFHEAAIRIREQSRTRGRSLHRRAVGSTLLLKGLESDVAVVLNADQLNRRNFYVAITRGARRLVVCSASQILSLPPN